MKSKKFPDGEVLIESFTESGRPLFITVQINFIQDETNAGPQGSRLFFTYDIVRIKACYHDKDGGPVDYSDYLDKDHTREIEEACIQEVFSYTRSA